MMHFDRGVLKSFDRGDLPGRHLRQVREHLADCCHCRDTIQVIQGDEYYIEGRQVSEAEWEEK